MFTGKRKVKVSASDLPGLKLGLREQLHITSDFTVHVYDPDFEEFYMLQRLSDVKNRAKVRLELAVEETD